MARILVVEDDPIFAALIAAWLERNAYVVCGITADPAEAIALARSEGADLCLIDLFLTAAPVGYDVACDVLERLGIQVVVMSARPPSELVVPCLAKPFTEEQLIGMVRRLTAPVRTRRALT
ncbi:response regulator [Arenibaculum pallidiluteum]|uniref:response regulator n=1 Tax=Arenibaculum pallidiluteum TaxID=2812559 RepID=UPI001A96B7D0|nr:response regulator [Arenibaculum pallidiluteum]